MATSQEIVAIGGIAGLEVALQLKKRGHQLIICEDSDSLSGQFALAGEAPRKEEMKEATLAMGVQALTIAKCLEIKDKSVVIDRMGNVEEIPCDSVVVAIGAKSRSFENITVFCEEPCGIPCHIIGDAGRARRALNAVTEANEVARLFNYKKLELYVPLKFEELLK